MNAPDVDDAAEPAIAHAGQNGAGQARHAGQHHLNEEIPACHRKLLEAGDLLQTRIVDQEIHQPRRRGDGGAHACVGSDIQRQRLHRPAGTADPRAHLVRIFAPDIADNDVVTSRGKLDRQAGADAAGGTVIKWCA